MDALIDTLPCGYAAFDDAGRLTAVNASLAAWLGGTPDALVGTHVEGMLTVAGRIFYQTHFFPLLKLHGKAEEIFLTLRSSTGDDVPVLANATREAAGECGLNHCVFLPVHQRRKYEDELLAARRQAEDALRSNEVLTQTRRELEHHARELDRKLSRLEQKNAELIRLSTILAHDLREPIRKLSVYAGLLEGEDREALTPMGARGVGVIRAETIRLDALVRGLYEYASLDGSDEAPAPVDLNAVVAAAHKIVSDRRGLSDLAVAAGPLPTVEGYRKQLELLFIHLIDNAVKFSKPNMPPRITVSGRLVQENSYRTTEGRYRYVDAVLIDVQDEGIGFEPRYRQYVFEALRKLDPDRPGLGLGLTICKKIAENHYGTLQAEATPTRGCRFTLMLPLQQ